MLTTRNQERQRNQTEIERDLPTDVRELSATGRPGRDLKIAGVVKHGWMGSPLQMGDSNI